MRIHSLRKLFFISIFIAITLELGPAFSSAHRPGNPPHQLYEMGDLKLESGEVIKDFAFSYVTHGKLNDKKSNAILMVPALGANHHRIDFLIGPGKALDTTKYFIICTDAIGNGLSTSPSNSKTQPGIKFPQFTIRDMVESQYRLVTEKFGLNRLVTVTGASMGGFQAIQWAVSHPDFIESVTALTGAARTSAWLAGVLTACNNSLKADPAWNNGNYEEQPEKGWRVWTNIILALLANSPEGINHLYPNAKGVIPFMKWWEDSWLKGKFDANNMIYQSNATIDHNVGYTPGFNGDHIKALKSIKAKVLLLLGRNDLLVTMDQVKEDVKYIKDVRVVEIPTRYGHFGASTLFPADVDFCNRIAREFLNDVTHFGRKLK
jgi:homoserine O-acetyltransferase